MSTPPHERALVIVNPISGRGKGESLGRELAEGLSRRGVACELLLTRAAGDATAAARALDPRCDLVVSVGGDGTLREVLTGLGQRSGGANGVRVGVLPMGTGNALGIDLGLPRDVDRALDVLCGEHTVAMDVADVNGHLSFLVTGVGPDAVVVRDIAERRVGGKLAKWHYVPAALRMLLRYRPRPLAVELDGRAVEGAVYQVLASNLVHYGGVMKLSPGRVLDDGLFEVFLFRRGDLLGLVGYCVRLLLGRVPGGSIEMRRARHVRVTAAEPVPFHIDGDPMGETPVDLEVTGVRYHLLVP
ncbi:MAG: YegS/Rv2252/BmrU family lipid kinase [Planctomycetes bacterium]|nr:YegS/Rv2252/BmrU family lipid kinase [Planctomycetota bacterium]